MTVALVGAGPGDPELITVRGLDRVRRAEVLVYDRLVVEELAAEAPGLRICREGLPQERINRLLVSYGRRGLRTVRLKGGDPFVFGRGGEEALALVRAGVEFELVPGVSSIAAVPGAAGIPVTHRGLAAGFAVLSGHAESAYAPVLSSLAPGSLTLVVLMGLRTRGELASALLARGWSPATPAAVVLGASHEGAARWLGTIATLPDAAIDSELAGILVIGEVVQLATAIANEHATAALAVRSS